MNSQVKFHGDSGDWISDNGFETLCLIAAEVCRGSRAIIENEAFEDEAERLFYDLAELLDEVGSELHECSKESRKAYKLDNFHNRCVDLAQQILEMNFCYAEDINKSWSELFDEWSYGAYSLCLSPK